MIFGNRVLETGSEGPDVVELQIRLAGFRGTVWDGSFGTGTKKQVEVFQSEYMGIEIPDGIFDVKTFDALLKFSNEFKIDFSEIVCDCGKCGGFGNNRYKNEYIGSSRKESFHKYEYPGIHKAILHSYKAAAFYFKKAGLPDIYLTSGYRCHENNKKNNRATTNHMGKALDIDFKNLQAKSVTDKNICNLGRGILVEKGHFQIGWLGENRKSLEPSNIAPSWIHMDVRQYEPKYLLDNFFVNSDQELNRV